MNMKKRRCGRNAKGFCEALDRGNLKSGGFLIGQESSTRKLTLF